MIHTRFAPSPNGSLHLGHAFAAIVAHDLAHTRGGRFALRIEDIDGARSRADLADEFLTDLTWLGLTWDGPVIRQSARLSRYAQAADTLRAMGLLYPCCCTRSEVTAAATRAGPDGPIYPGTCRGRDVAPDGAASSVGPAFSGGVAWRLDVARALALSGPLFWHDELAGKQCADAGIFGDIVLVRKDAPASYHLAATVDDAADGVTLVTRGIDLFAATHIHRLLQALLGLPVPVWHHHGVLVDESGGKLAKRRGSPSLAERRRAGEDGRALARQLRDGQFPAGIYFRAVID